MKWSCCDIYNETWKVFVMVKILKMYNMIFTL